MIMETLIATGLLATCPGTDYRNCGDVDPAPYTAFVSHHGNHDGEDGDDGEDEPADTPSEPDAPSEGECQ